MLLLGLQACKQQKAVTETSRETAHLTGDAFVMTDTETHTLKYYYTCYNCSNLEALLKEVPAEMIASFKLAKDEYPKSIADNFEDGTSREFSSRPDEMTGKLMVTDANSDGPPLIEKYYTVGIDDTGNYYCRER